MMMSSTDREKARLQEEVAKRKAQKEKKKLEAQARKAEIAKKKEEKRKAEAEERRRKQAPKNKKEEKLRLAVNKEQQDHLPTLLRQAQGDAKLPTNTPTAPEQRACRSMHTMQAAEPQAAAAAPTIRARGSVRLLVQTVWLGPSWMQVRRSVPMGHGL
ncbi:unnamed protein product [Symbiodinium sp. CCMP2592]|nr:unnamed protein product [Symbiodinium sp. CCMP2592]